MPTAATVQDVADLTGTDLTDDTARVERLLDRAERTIAGELPGFRFGAVTGEAVTVHGDGSEVLRLPYYPVRAVTSVTVDGTALDADAWAVDVLGHLRRLDTSSTLSPHGSLDGLARRWPDRGVIIVVTYDYGYHPSASYAGAAAGPSSDIVPDVIGDLAAELAAARIVNPSQVSQEALGDRSVSYGPSTGAGDRLSRDQRRRLRHWRRNRFGSVRVVS